MRMLYLFATVLLASSFLCCAQNKTFEPVITQQLIRIGHVNVTIEKRVYGDTAAPFLLLLHDNERTARQVTQTFLKAHGGSQISIDNKGHRYIHFQLNGKSYRFDPNRMFSTYGIRKNLMDHSRYNAEAAKAIKKFSQNFETFFPDTALIIALHNNTEGAYSVRSYKTISWLRADAREVYINPKADLDDFFITTDASVFAALKERQFNAVLQKQKTVNDDGSLSFYFGRKNQPYINIEAQYGHHAIQASMLQNLMEILKLQTAKAVVEQTGMRF